MLLLLIIRNELYRYRCLYKSSKVPFNVENGYINGYIQVPTCPGLVMY